MGISTLRMSFRNLSLFDDRGFTIDFVTEKRVFSEEVDDGIVSHLFGRIYKLNVIALAGINATGKTTALALLSGFLQVFIGNDSLDYAARYSAYFESELEVESYYYKEEENCIYKLVSAIKKDDVQQGLFFENEKLYRKPALAETNKNNLFDFEEDTIVIDRRAVENAFLKKEDSIFSSIMNAYEQAGNSVQDLCSITNHNWISAFAFDLVIPFVQYLDPSIEYIKVKDMPTSQASRVVFEIKFKQQQNAVAVEPRDLELYLSSGTIKGISCFSAIAIALETGGYVLIDEIENHLSKTIVISLIDLFMSDLNKKKATLLFSTHYSEILDCIDRSDGIYLLDKDDSIQVRKFSVAANGKDRKDKKKSDLVLSGVLSKAPSYQAYRQLVKSLGQYLWGGDSR